MWAVEQYQKSNKYATSGESKSTEAQESYLINETVAKNRSRI